MFERKKFDFYLFLPLVFLLIFSFGMIASVSPSFLTNQIIYVLTAVIFYFLFSLIDLEILFSVSPLIYFASLIFLILPFVFGTVTRGSVRWIPLGSFTLQPSEIIKPFLCIFSAWYWSRKNYSLKNLVYFSFFFTPVILIVFVQPDLGSALVIASIFIGGVLFSGMPAKNILSAVLILLLIMPLSWFTLKNYQKTRFLHFLNPASDPLGEGYNQIQATITVGSGKLFGWGLGKGTQSHLSFLQERHTDFIFSSMAEEFGFVGCLSLLFLYLFLFSRILKIARFANERKKFLLLIGLFISFSFQTVINVGMNIGLLPITGITLPLFSYGGSSLLASMIGLGLIQNISLQTKESKIASITHL